MKAQKLAMPDLTWDRNINVGPHFLDKVVDMLEKEPNQVAALGRVHVSRPGSRRPETRPDMEHRRGRQL